MPSLLDELVKLLALEKIEENLFRGQSQDLGWGTVFGGQVLGQALSAAGRTVLPERQVHSLHAYFLRPGDVRAPIVYDVDRIRDGGSFTTRRVVAIQHGEAIFNLAASFQKPEPGFEHQDPMPEVGPPESFLTDPQRLARHLQRMPENLRARALAERPFEMRAGDDEDPMAPGIGPARRTVWLRTIHALPDDPAVHTALLAYASDYSFLTTALRPHGVGWMTPGMQVASLDHVMWFHQPFRADQWLLHEMQSPVARAGRGLVRGSIYSHDGRLIASTAQEGLIRNKPPSGPAKSS